MNLREIVEMNLGVFLSDKGITPGAVPVEIGTIHKAFMDYTNGKLPVTPHLLGRILTKRFIKQQRGKQRYFLNKGL